jgi:hypothetical protein
MFDEITLLSLLVAFNDRQCVDPRDTVFALLGMASDCRDLDPQFALIADYSQTLFSVYMNVFKFSWERLSRDGQRFDEGDQIGQEKVYSQVLLLFLQCCTSPDKTSSFKPPWTPGDRFELFELMTTMDNIIYEQAKKSLQECGRKEGMDEVLKWLEDPCSHLDRNKAIEDFRQWPFDFPAVVRHIAKLQLFLEAFMRSGMEISTVEARTKISLPLSNRLCLDLTAVVMVDNNTGSFEVVGRSENWTKFYIRFEDSWHWTTNFL